MGRRAKGDRHKVIASMPPEAADMVRSEAIAMGCYVGDYLGWLVAHHLGMNLDPPVGGVIDHPAPSPASEGRLRYPAMVPRPAADQVLALANVRGTTMGDIVTDMVCHHFDIPFTPKVWRRTKPAGEQLPMTG